MLYYRTFNFLVQPLTFDDDDELDSIIFTSSSEDEEEQEVEPIKVSDNDDDDQDAAKDASSDVGNRKRPIRKASWVTA